MENNNCPHIFECTDYPNKCNRFKKKKKSYFEPADERGVIPMHISPIDQYRFAWEEGKMPIPFRVTCHTS